MITLNQLIILYKDIAARHEMVNDFEVAQDFNIGADNDINYPILVVNPTGANLPRTEGGYTSFTTTFELQVIDLVNKNNDNRLDVLSDTQQIINDVVNEFNTHPYYVDSGIDTIGDISFTPLRGVYNDDADGWKITMELEHPNKLSYCGNPIENLSGFDFTHASVTVIDGLNQFELFPTQTYECTSGEPTVVNVSNSNDSYDVNTATDLELPNIDFTDSDGTTTSVPSMEDLVCSPATVQSGIGYRRPLLTGQTVSYAVYDDGWNLANGVYDYTPPPVPLYTQSLDLDSVTPLLILKNLNSFGNYNRFTDDTGAVATTQEWIIDHLTGLMWSNRFVWRDSFNNVLGIGGAIETQNALGNWGGYTDWRMASRCDLESVMTTNYTVGIDSGVILPNLPNVNLHTSSIYGANTSNAFRKNGTNSIFQAGTLTDTTPYLVVVRNYYN